MCLCISLHVYPSAGEALGAIGDPVVLDLLRDYSRDPVIEVYTLLHVLNLPRTCCHFKERKQHSGPDTCRQAGERALISGIRLGGVSRPAGRLAAGERSSLLALTCVTQLWMEWEG